MTEVPMLPVNGNGADNLGHLQDMSADILGLSESEVKPFRRQGLGYTFDPPGFAVRLRVERVHRHSDEATAMLLIENLHGELIHHARHNLTSVTAQRDLAKWLTDAAPLVNWRKVLVDFSASIMTAEAKGEPFMRLGHLPRKPRQTYLVNPLLVEHKPNILYAPGGSGKGQVACWLVAGVQAGVPTVCGMAFKQANVLYLDWEDDEDTIQERVLAMAAGLGIPAPEFFYRHCTADLRSQVESVSRFIDEHDIGFVIIDSFEQAAGSSDSNETYQQRAISVLNAVRHLGRVTTLIIDHVSAEEQRSDRQGVAKPYGSQFKLNGVRWGWELRKDQGAGSALMQIGLFHAKHNNTLEFPPIGLLIDFTDEDCIPVMTCDVASSEALGKRIPLNDRIAGVLRNGNRLPQALADILDAPVDSIRKALQRARGSKFVELPDGSWGNLGHDDHRTGGAYGMDSEPSQVANNSGGGYDNAPFPF